MLFFLCNLSYYFRKKVLAIQVTCRCSSVRVCATVQWNMIPYLRSEPSITFKLCVLDHQMAHASLRGCAVSHGAFDGRQCNKNLFKLADQYVLKTNMH